jgi:hypothetical protein
MFDKLFGCGCKRGCFEKRDCNTSCDVLWIVILFMVLCNGGIFGLDICTIIILFVLFGGNFLGGFGGKCCEKPCC